MPRGILHSPGGMLKLRFDWYIINYEKFFCCIRDQGLCVKISIFVRRTFFQCSSPSSSLAGRGALRNSCPSCCEGDQNEVGAIIESGGQFIPYGFYFRLRARRIITYRATKSPQQATKVAKSHPAEKTCNFVLCILSITWEYKQQISVGGAVRKETLSSQYVENQMTLARAHNRDTHWCVVCCFFFQIHVSSSGSSSTALEDKLQQGKNVASTLLVYKYHWMLCKDQYFHNPHFRRVRQGMKQHIYGKAMICRATIDQPDLCTASVRKLGSCGAVDHKFGI